MEREYQFIPYNRDTYSSDEMKERSAEFYKWMNSRRTVREFSNKEVPSDVIEDIIMSASTAPSGAHKQPWTFCAIGDPAVKKKIRGLQKKKNMRTTMDA